MRQKETIPTDAQRNSCLVAELDFIENSTRHLRIMPASCHQEIWPCGRWPARGKATTKLTKATIDTLEVIGVDMSHLQMNMPSFPMYVV
jgi:hypothetical protein